MANFKVKYVSEAHLDRDWGFAPGHWFKMDWAQLESEFPDPACYLVALDAKQLNAIHQLVSVFPKYYRNWGYTKTTLDAVAWDNIQTFISELELCLMSGCKVEDLTAKLDRLTAAIAGEVVTVDGTEYDYTESGLNPQLSAIKDSLQVDNLIYPDMTVAEILQTGLIGRQLDVTPPFAGEGLADITDEQLQTLHQRFVMTDSSIFNPLTDTKNITEALETLLRRDKITDLEFLTPNVATILEDTFNVGDGLPAATIKTIGRAIAKAIGLPQSTIDSLIPTDKEYFSTAEILLLMLQAMQKMSQMSLNADTTINLNNTTNCNGSGKNGNAPADEQPTTLQITDEGVVITGPDQPSPPLLGEGG